MRQLASLVAGVLFGAGLTVSQMVQPSKVLDFLDIAGIAKGTWDPTLMFVFAGALAVMFVAYAVQRRMVKPLLGPAFLIPQRTDLDMRLLAGSAMFGIGWGLVGICPGPALAALTLAGTEMGKVALFVAAMIAGVQLSRLVAPTGIDAAPPAAEPRT